MKTIIKAGLLFFLFAAVTSCTKESMKSTITQSSNQPTAQTTNAEALTVHHIGDAFGGGVIFYLDATGKHGLIAAKKDISTTGVRWYNKGYVLIGNTLSSIGTGASNTAKIINKQGNTGSYAAKLCADLVLNGFSDWYLPSRKEIGQMYRNRSVVPGLQATNYWSSTEVDLNNAYSEIFNGGFQEVDDKSFTLRVRAVRSF